MAKELDWQLHTQYQPSKWNRKSRPNIAVGGESSKLLNGETIISICWVPRSSHLPAIAIGFE